MRAFSVFLFAFVLVVCVGVCAGTQAQWRPVVVLHGLTGSVKKMVDVVAWIEADYPGIYVKNVEIGDGGFDSIFMGMNQQLDLFAQSIQADPKLAGGFNLIGYSQGGLITRGYIERYNNPPVHNYITWSSPHGGQYGIPDLNDPGLLKLFDRILNGEWSESWMQEHISFASYWRDPYALQDYIQYSTYLADLNNVKTTKNALYKKNIVSLNSFTVLFSTVDKVVVPKESGWFWNFATNSNTTLVPLVDQPMYTEDWLGLQQLNTTGRLFAYSTDCPHREYPQPQCKHWYDLYTKPLLNNTIVN